MTDEWFKNFSVIVDPIAMRTALIIDDSNDFRTITADYLLDADFDVLEAACPDDAFKILHDETPDVIICDLTMPFTLGPNFIHYPFSTEVGRRTILELVTVYPSMPIIAVTAIAPHEIAAATRGLGTVPVLSKPFKPEDLFREISRLSALKYSETLH